MGNKASHTTSASKLDAHLSRPSALQRDMFALRATAHHGVPSNAKALAFCDLQGILAVGTASGAVKFYGADGLEVFVEGYESTLHLTVGVTHLHFTARQHLVVGYEDSSIRVFDPASGTIVSCVSDAWTTSVITSLETPKYTMFPFFFVATDDGDVHVVHEETGQVSTYVIRPQDLSVAQLEGITAMATCPRDANLLLIAYDNYPAVLLWDFAKRKVVREYTLSAKTHKVADIDKSICNSPQCLSWHSSGKRFVAGYKYGGFAVFRVDKAQGFYREVAESAPRDTPLKQIKWLCAPPTSSQSALPGAIVYSRASTSNVLTLLHPSNGGRSSDDVLTDLFKADKLPWLVAHIQSVNHAPVTAFEAALDHVDNSAKVAPLSLMLLSGNPLEGCLPTVSVQCLPCFVRFSEGDKEEWEWRMERLPEAAIIPPHLQSSPLTTFALVNLSHVDDTLQNDLIAAFDPATISSMLGVATSGDFEWPIYGGSVMDPIPNGFFATSGTAIKPNTTLLLTGHANGCVLFWEARVAQDRLSKGAICLLHIVNAPLLLSSALVNTEITCLNFCPASRTLVLGFASGEIAVLDFDMGKSGQTLSMMDAPEKQNMPTTTDETTLQMLKKDKMGFNLRFVLHIHTEPIAKLALSSLYDYVAVADAAGMTSLVEMKTQQFQILISDVLQSSDEAMTVNSLLMNELVQTTEIHGNESTMVSGPESNSKGSLEPTNDDPNRLNMVQHREVIPVLFVGRGSGKLEMFHVQSATKMGERLVDSEKSTSLASILMIDGHGEHIEIPGRDWNAVGNSESVISSNSVLPEATETSQKEEAGEDVVTQPVDMDYEMTQQLVTEALSEQVNKEELSYSPNHLFHVTAPPGSLGLHLCMEVKQHALVKGFAEDSCTAAILRENGVCIGHTLIAINGVDVSVLERDAVCSVLGKLQEREKRLVFAQNLNDIHNSETFGNSAGWLRSVAAIEGPRYLVCACGRTLHLVQATIPQAAEMARGLNDCPVQPLASFELKGPVVVMSVVRVPVGETIENCLAVVDQSNRVYILSLPSLHLIWDTECSKSVSCNLVEISFGGELVVANNFGEIDRFSLFAEATAMESAMLERKTVKTRLYRPERIAVLSQKDTASSSPLSGKKRGMAADAGKMFKKLVLSVTQEATDLTKVFLFSTEADERKQLLGDRSPVAKDATAKTETEANATKNSLLQAQQRLAERGEKLNDLGLKTEQMKKTSEDFYQTMKAFNEKNANKKWYEF